MKKIFFCFFSAAIITFAAINFDINLRDESLSSLALANIEALARNEHPGGDCASCCDAKCHDCFDNGDHFRCLSKSACYNARFTVKTCPEGL